MLIRNEICEHLKQALQENIQQAQILLDDIAIYDINHAPFIVIKQENTEISSPSSDSWKHNLGLEIAIITTSKTLGNISIIKLFTSHTIIFLACFIGIFLFCFHPYFTSLM